MRYNAAFYISTLVLAVAAGGTWRMPAGEAQAEGLSDAEIEALIRNLGDEDFGVREAATNALFPHARACWTRLQAAARSSEAEVRERAQKILAACYREQLKTLITREKVLLAMAQVESRAVLPPLTAKYKECEAACSGWQVRYDDAQKEFERAQAKILYRTRRERDEQSHLKGLTEAELTEGMRNRLAVAKLVLADADREVSDLKTALETKREDLRREKASGEAAMTEAFEALKRTRIEREIQEAVLASRIAQLDEAIKDTPASVMLDLAGPPERWDPGTLPWERRVKGLLFLPGVCATVRSAARIFEQAAGIPVEVSGKGRTDRDLENSIRGSRAAAGGTALPGGEFARAEKFLNDISRLRGVKVEIDREKGRVRIEIQDAE